MTDALTTKAVCRYTSDCDGGNLQCIDSRCMCDPAWAHTGLNCDEPTWTSWALAVVLTTVGVLSVLVLASAAKKLSTTPSRWGSGMVQLARMLFQRQNEEDSGTTTLRVVLLSVIIDVVHDVWKMLTAVGVISDPTAGYWQARILFPLSEALMILPAAIVVSVWVDVANSTMSRSKSKKRLERSKQVLQLGTGLYTVLLLLMSIFGHKDLAMVVQLGAIGAGLTACGSGAGKLCNTLREMGASSVSIADTVFKVSRSMGVSLYIIFIGNTMILSSRTRKSNPANLALLGTLVSSSARCYLNKAIFEYMVESTRAKKARKIASAQRKRSGFKINRAARLVVSLHSIGRLKARRVAAELQDNGDEASEASLGTTSSCTNINGLSIHAPKSHTTQDGPEGEDDKGLVDGAAEEKPKITPVARLVSTLHSISRRMAHRVAAELQDNGDEASDARLGPTSSCTKVNGLYIDDSMSQPTKSGPEGGDKKGLVDGAAEEKPTWEEVKHFEADN